MWSSRKPLLVTGSMELTAWSHAKLGAEFAVAIGTQKPSYPRTSQTTRLNFKASTLSATDSIVDIVSLMV